MNFFELVVSILTKYWPMFLRGVGNTLLIALTATVIGLLIGIVIGIIRTIPPSRNKLVFVLQKVLNAVIAIYIEVFRGTPMMVQAMVIYWGYAFINNGKTLPLLVSAIIIVSINTGAYIAEIVRGGIVSIDKGQFDGAYSVGMTHFQAMVHVILPQVLRNILPAVSNEFVINIKDTSVLNVISVTELYYQSYSINTITYQPFATYTVTCLLYLIMTFTITRFLRFLEKKLEGADTYKLIGMEEMRK